MDQTNILVVGAGVVGLAVARALAVLGREVIVIERNLYAGAETSSRNSGVIHSGIYYPSLSRKARWCVIGRELLYAYCEQYGVNHRRCGKLVVAQADQVPQLQQLQRQANANGVTDLRWLSGRDAQRLEPDLHCTAALLSPSTGIVDAHEYLTSLRANLDTLSATVVFDTELLTARPQQGQIIAAIRSGGTESELACRWLINCAGLGAVGLTARIAGYPADRVRQAYFAKGNYFTCTAGQPFRHLVYPMPTSASLGLHATLDLSGSMRFGPDVEWIDTLDYNVDETRAARFYTAIRQYWPGLPEGTLQPGYAGIRPKLVGAGQPAADFVVEGPEDHGIAGLINLLGIESPGLTASLAIGEDLAQNFIH